MAGDAGAGCGRCAEGGGRCGGRSAHAQAACGDAPAPGRRSGGRRSGCRRRCSRGSKASWRCASALTASRQHVFAYCPRGRVHSMQAGKLLCTLRRHNAAVLDCFIHSRAPECGHAGHTEPGAAPSVAARAASLGAGAPLAQHGNAGGHAAGSELHGELPTPAPLILSSSGQVLRTAGGGRSMCLLQVACMCDA